MGCMGGNGVGIFNTQFVVYFRAEKLKKTREKFTTTHLVIRR